MPQPCPPPPSGTAAAPPAPSTPASRSASGRFPSRGTSVSAPGEGSGNRGLGSALRGRRWRREMGGRGTLSTHRRRKAGDGGDMVEGEARPPLTRPWTETRCRRYSGTDVITGGREGGTRADTARTPCPRPRWVGLKRTTIPSLPASGEPPGTIPILPARSRTEPVRGGAAACAPSRHCATSPLAPSLRPHRACAAASSSHPCAPAPRMRGRLPPPRPAPSSACS